ncbi:MAG: PHP domain-containing protein [bacterium]
MMKVNPFEARGRWYKGNLHTHTTNSDGELAPRDAVEWYRSRGYDFLSITDHNRLTDVEGLSTSSFLVIPGVELDVNTGISNHVVGLGIEGFDGVPEGIPPEGLIDLILQWGGKAIVAHPYWSGQTVAELSGFRGAIGMEVFNMTCHVSIGKGLSSVHWDNLLERGQVWWGVASDDAHWRRKDYGGGWVMVKSPALSQGAILGALEAGSFYASSGPEIFDLRIEGGKAWVRCSPVVAVNFICKMWKGRRIEAPEGGTLTEAEYALKGDEGYIRVECIDRFGHCAWSNPFLV